MAAEVATALRVLERSVQEEMAVREETMREQLQTTATATEWTNRYLIHFLNTSGKPV